ncbi:MAG: aconitase X catalytic domain-containing protein [Candidatus Nezhaarchaeales archaeon]
MKLGRTEKLMLKGYYGEACKKALELVIAIAESYGYGELVRIKGAHISGISYKNIGDSGLEYLRDLVEGGARVRVKTTTNPCGFDLDKPWLFDVDEDFFKRQMEILRLLKEMGAKLSLTCTPYYVDNKPRRGDHIAWAESSAVIYANSIIGAYTNRESGPSALAAAITGRSALTRDHTDERGPSIVIDVEAKVLDYFDWSLLGFVVGKLAPDEIPLLKIKGRTCNNDELKCLCAGLGASSTTSIFWLTIDGHDVGHGVKRISITRRDLREVSNKWTLTREPTLIFIGCPHCSLREIKEIARELRGKKVKRDIRLLISTSRSVYTMASKLGLVEVLEGAGAHLIKDTCLVVSPIKLSKSDVVLTDSAKTAYYAETITNAMMAVGSRRECLKVATE